MNLDKEIRNLFTNTIYLYLVQGLNYLLPVLVLPFLIKILSVESFGIYSFAFAFSQFISLFVDFGFNISVTKKIAENNDDFVLVKNTFWNIIIIKSFLSFFSISVALAVLFSIQKFHIYAIAVSYSFLSILGGVFFPLWWFQGVNKMRAMSVINALSKLLTFPFIFVFVREANDHIIAIVIQSMSLVLCGVLSFIYLYITNPNYFKNVTIGRDLSIYMEEIRNSFGIFLSNSSISLYTNSLTILLGIFSTSYNVGLFGAMDRIVRVLCSGVIGPVTQACFPIIVGLKKHNLARAKKLVRVVTVVVFVVMAFCYITFYLGKQHIFNNFLRGYTDVEWMFYIFLLIIFPISLAAVIGNLGLLGLGGEPEKRMFSKVYIYTGLLSLPVSIFAIKFYQVWGAIIVMITIEILILLLLVGVTKKKKLFNSTVYFN